MAQHDLYFYRKIAISVKDTVSSSSGSTHLCPGNAVVRVGVAEGVLSPALCLHPDHGHTHAGLVYCNVRQTIRV